MFLRFSVANYRSVLERQELTMVATSLRDNGEGLIPSALSPSGNLVPAAILYGANASGKSNILAALEFLKFSALVSHVVGRPGSEIPRQRFLLAPDTTDKPSEFDIDFVVDGVRYHYGFAATNHSFVSEWLYSFPAGRRQILYEREGPAQISFGKNLKGRNRIIADLMRENSLFFSTALQNNHEEITKLSNFFRSIKFKMAVSVGALELSMQFLNADIDGRAIDFLKRVGTGITGFKRVENEPVEEQLNSLDALFLSDKKQIFIELAHKGASGEDVFFEPEIESSGTRRLLYLLSAAFNALETGSLLVVDELDASLHTQVCEAIISLFSHPSTNPKGAQLIATTHDTNLMRASILRRDQIWFTEKDEKGATHLFPLSDVQTRKTDNIEKGYLQGRFGAIPFAGSVAELFQRD